METAAQVVLEGGRRGRGLTAARLSWVRQCDERDDVIWEVKRCKSVGGKRAMQPGAIVVSAMEVVTVALNLAS
jgi:hypothetical protein